jgi:hypothetical protein
MSKYGAIEICEKYGLPVRHGGETPTEDTRVKKTPGPRHSKTIEIICIDCGAKRQVLPQDVFHCKRCKPCQKKYSRTRITVMGAAEEFRKKLLQERGVK